VTSIRLAHSPDADDAFMFWAATTGRIDTEGLSFEVVRADTEALNALAEIEGADVVAISIAQYARVADRYLLLPHGGSVGEGYGPVVVSMRPASNVVLEGARIGVPGLRTTAYLVLRILLPRFTPVVLPISPHEAVFDALQAGTVDAALLIHEGRLTFESRGLHRILELGEAWHTRTGLPLPLGGNVIRRALGADVVALTSRVLGRSIAYALEHRDLAMDAILASPVAARARLDRPTLDRYLAMYANERTLDYGPDGRRAISEVLAEAHLAGLCERLVTPQFAEG